MAGELDQTLEIDTSLASDDLEPDDASAVFGQEVWVATLDDATCIECGDLDGEVFDEGDGDQPPIHYNCRCIRTAVIDGGLIGDRPAVPITEDQLDGLTPDERTAAVQELVGSVPATTDYETWLADQSEAFQDDVLGPARAQMFRDGMPLGDFLDANGDVLTLDELNAGVYTGEEAAAEEVLAAEGRAAAEAEAAAAEEFPIPDNGVVAFGKDDTKAYSLDWANDSPIKTVQDLYQNSVELKAALDELGQQIGDDTGSIFKAASIKKRPFPGDTPTNNSNDNRVLIKLGKGKAPAEVSDVVRSSFIVSSPEQADAIVRALAEHYPVLDENWRVTPVGYFDRPLKIILPNGQFGEVLLAPQELIDAKGNGGGGHVLYEAWRKITMDGTANLRSPEALRLAAEQLRLYGDARTAMGTAWDGVLNGSTEGAKEMAEQIKIISQEAAKAAIWTVEVQLTEVLTEEEQFAAHELLLKLMSLKDAVDAGQSLVDGNLTVADIIRNIDLLLGA